MLFSNVTFYQANKPIICLVFYTFPLHLDFVYQKHPTTMNSSDLPSQRFLPHSAGLQPAI
jgi:hypothetical protein